MKEITQLEQFEKLIDEYQNLILSICFKMTKDYFAAQDLTQETFLSAYIHAGEFTGDKQKAWLCRIASNKCIDYLRQGCRSQVPTADTDMESYLSKTGQPEHEAMEACIEQELLSNCRGLKPPYDEIAYQYFCKEKTPQEIATKLDMKLKTVQTQIYRARDMLRKMYENQRKEWYSGREEL